MSLFRPVDTSSSPSQSIEAYECFSGTSTFIFLVTGENVEDGWLNVQINIIISNVIINLLVLSRIRISLQES